MKVLLFYRSFRQQEEIEISAGLLSRTKTLKNFDLTLHCNNIESNIWNYFSKFPNKNKELIHTSRNAGYLKGCFQSLSRNYHNFKEYDYVVHIQADVFILNEHQIIKILNEYKHTKDVFICTKSKQDERFLSFDFFIFKPKLLKENIFNRWKDSQFNRETLELKPKETKPPTNKPLSPELLLYKILTVEKIPYKLIKRYDNDQWSPRRIDLLNLWHEHDVDKVKKYISSNGLL